MRKRERKGRENEDREGKGDGKRREIEKGRQTSDEGRVGE